MNNLNTEMENFVDYNAEPVLYCEHCLSLRIMSIDGTENTEFCDNCNSTDIKQTSIEEWETLYEKRYGKKYLTT